tara:strand:+ start:68 stop:847 length:780 start_codon:yes stop_codon:yes gene_type:complete
MKLFNEKGNVSFDKVRTKIAKLLRLQTSSNAGEAANAAAFVEKLCAKYNVSSTDCKDYDPEKDEVVEFQLGKAYRKANVAEQNLIHGVTKYFNGQTIITYIPSNSMYYEPPKKIMNVIASRGNKIQIELYLEYLIETMNKLADEAKKSGGYGTARTTYKTNWKKGFSKKIADRLVAMKNEQKRNGKPELNEPALVVLNRNRIEQKATLAFLEEQYPNRTRSRRTRCSGVGYADGSSKAESIGLNKQTGASKETLALTGN